MEFLFDAEDFPQEEIGALSEALSSELSSAFSADAPLKFELLLVSEEEIRDLNRRFRNRDAVTDVLSFPSTRIEGGKIKSADHSDCRDGDALLLGSVVVCQKRAEEQAEEYGHSFKRELYYLSVHGVLHCLGYDHETEEERARMREREEAVMSRLKLPRE